MSDARTEPRGAAPGDDRRREYEPPAITFFEELEALAVDCRMVSGAKNSVYICNEGPLSS
jgi:hypothetical protein